MAIILNDFVEINTPVSDLKQSIDMQKGTKFCLDFGRLNFDFDEICFPIYLVPLDVGFQCPRTLVYNNDKEVCIHSKFGLFDYDFINIDIPHIVINESKYNDYGVIISKMNPYFGIFNEFAKHFKYVPQNNMESFVLTNKELQSFALIPFELIYITYPNNCESTFAIKNIGNQMDEEEYYEFIDEMVDDDSFL